MIDHKDLFEVVSAVVAYAEKHRCPPTIKELSEALFMSRGAVEYRLKYLQRIGLVQDNAPRQSVRLVGEMYLPPLWATSPKIILERLPVKNRKLARSF